MKIKITKKQAEEMIKENFYYFGRFDHEIPGIIKAWKKQGYIKEK